MGIYTNIKAVIIAAIILLFTYFYYSRNGGNFLSLGAVIIFGFISIIALIFFTLIVKLIAHYTTTEVIYPHILFRILIPFLVISLLFWLVYAIVTISPFGHFADFISAIKEFFTTHILYITICSIIVGVVLSLPIESNHINKNALFYNNSKFCISLIIAFVLSIFIFYWANKINQPTLDSKYNNYKNLDDDITSENYEIEFLIDAGEYCSMSEPYLLTSKSEIIINSLFDSSNKRDPLKMCFRINKSGTIIDSLDSAGLLPQNEQINFENGYLTENHTSRIFTWVFDQNKTVQNADSLHIKDDWKINTIPKNNTNLKLDYFFKTSKFHCNAHPEIKWNGTRYYHILKNTDSLKIKIDEVYFTTDRIQNCDEKTLEYFECKGMDFDLIRLNKRTYYIIRKKSNKS